MSAKLRRISGRLDAWLEGRLVVGETLREGIADLGDRDHTTVHIDELLGPRWRPANAEVLRTSLEAFSVLCEKAAAYPVAWVLLGIPLKPTRFDAGVVPSTRRIEHRLDAAEPPELAIYQHHAAARVQRWLRRWPTLGVMDAFGSARGKLIALPVADRKRGTHEMTEMLVLSARPAKQASLPSSTGVPSGTRRPRPALTPQRIAELSDLAKKIDREEAEQIKAEARAILRRMRRSRD